MNDVFKQLLRGFQYFHLVKHQVQQQPGYPTIPSSKWMDLVELVERLSGQVNTGHQVGVVPIPSAYALDKLGHFKLDLRSMDGDEACSGDDNGMNHVTVISPTPINSVDYDLVQISDHSIGARRSLFDVGPEKT